MCKNHMDRKNCVCSDDNERCMIGKCKECNGQNGLVDILNQCDELIDVEEVTYKQWVSNVVTDRTQLVTITESKEDFIKNLSTQVFKLTRHRYTAKCQSGYI